MGYFDKKIENSARANEHTEYVSKKYKDEIEKCVSLTKEADDTSLSSFSFKNLEGTDNKDIYLNDMTSSEAILSCSPDEKACVLNFASFKNPGGMFLNGSSAQEECLCHDSFLYNVLKEERSYYEYNKEHLNNGLYMNRALYSPNVVFEINSQKRLCDVLTCASPNFSVYRYGKITKEENTKALESRIDFVLKLAQTREVDTLILGAYGCGVFKQDPYEVAMLFKKGLEEYSFKKVLFAIPGPLTENYKAFKEVLQK